MQELWQHRLLASATVRSLVSPRTGPTSAKGREEPIEALALSVDRKNSRHRARLPRRIEARFSVADLDFGELPQ